MPWIDDGRKLTDDTVVITMKKNTIREFTVIDKTVTMGTNNVILPGTQIYGNVSIGSNNIIGPHSVIGTPPQHRSHYDKGNRKTKGGIVICNNNVIREFTTVHAPMEKFTYIGNNCFLMAYSHVSHDTRLMDRVTMTNCVELAGHSLIQDGATIGLNSAVHQYTTIGAYSMIGMGSIITKDIPPFLLYTNFECNKVNEIGLSRNGFSPNDIAKINLFFEKNENDFNPRTVDRAPLSKKVKGILIKFLAERNSSREISPFNIRQDRKIISHRK
jgi:UDP-N-acetylglucosamine acyltransferase